MASNHKKLLFLTVSFCLLSVGLYLFLSLPEGKIIQSPYDGTMIILVTNNTQILDRTKFGTIRLRVQKMQNPLPITLLDTLTDASWRLSWSVQWLDNSHIKLKSSDVGSICWSEKENKKWVKADC